MTDEYIWRSYYAAAINGVVREYESHDILDTNPHINGLACVARDAALLADAAIKENRARWPRIENKR